MDNSKNEISQESNKWQEHPSVISLDKLQQGVLVASENGQVHFANVAFREFTGLHNHEIFVEGYLYELFDAISLSQILDNLLTHSSYEILVELKNVADQNTMSKVTLIPILRFQGISSRILLFYFPSPIKSKRI